MKEHHYKNLDRLCRRFGVSGLRDLLYHVMNGDNFRQLAQVYGVDVYDLRYLDQIHQIVHCYIYEKEQAKQLRFIAGGLMRETQAQQSSGESSLPLSA